MNKSAIIIVVLLLLVIAGGVGFVAWTGHQEREEAKQEELARQGRIEQGRIERQRRAAERERQRCDILYQAFKNSNFTGKISDCEAGYVEDIDSKWEKVNFWAKWEGSGLFGGSGERYKYSVEIRKDGSKYRRFGQEH